ncbi:glycine cleavage system H protein [alpha proteobacterium U9-1i]|nr:glycine cleavage system H protein [alpha proteobacterium U9-1i]
MTTRYTKDHEWVRLDGDVATVGITPYAAEQLGDVVYVELPGVGKAVSAGGEMAVVESAKAASDVYAPVAGEVVAVNDALSGSPDLVNQSADGDGWFVKLKPSNKAELDALMDAAAYAVYVKGL